MELKKKDFNTTVVGWDDTKFKKPGSPAPKTKKRPKILDEDSYSQNLENIIERDFYPDLPKLKVQTEFVDAWEKNNIIKLTELQMKYGSQRNAGHKAAESAYASPTTFETPVRTLSESESLSSLNVQESDGTSNTLANKDQKLSLDEYLSKYTSEDNAAFGVIMEEAKKLHQFKFGWLYEKEGKIPQRENGNQIVPNLTEQAVEYKPSATLDTWNYKIQNTLMYVPDGVEPTDAELKELNNKKKTIVHPSTRFQKSPFNEQANKQAISEAAQIQARTKEGKIGIDGREVLPAMSPKVNGYGFVVTPSPAPGVDESPLMTWGEIEGTPFQLDGSQTPVPHSPGPTFHIPDLPAREKLALELTEKVNQKHRAKKKEAMNAVQKHLSSPGLRLHSRCTSERLASMTPAAQKLASTRLGIRTGTDKALQASYTPSVSPSVKTPGLTPLLGLESTPRTNSTPRTECHTPKASSSSSYPSSLTDNLLNLPKRKKAHDFFSP